jgi:glycosyltransferase involved in cell wall biosynthesis/SAM-dependent methyltransferase
MVLAEMPSAHDLLVVDDEKDFYGRQYYEHHVIHHNKLPSLAQRARTDLPERCAHWLRTFLRYKVPPGKVLEIGSAHGGFVALLRWAGFDATGLELSPWLVELARSIFEVSILQGPVESQDIEPQSLDAVVLMDVLEHLHDPKTTMERCLSLLKPDGILLIQTPCYPEGRSFEQMLKEDNPFLPMLMPIEHTFLFSRQSVCQLFDQSGAGYIHFEPAIFSNYDMFLAAGTAPLATLSEEDSLLQLEASPGGRLVRALLDLRGQFQDLLSRYRESESDRAGRMVSLERIQQLLTESEIDRGARLENIWKLEKWLAEANITLAARQEVTVAQERHLIEVQRSRDELAAQNRSLTEQLAAAERYLELVPHSRKELDTKRRVSAFELEAQNAERLERLEEAERRLAEVQRSWDRLEAAGKAQGEQLAKAERQLAEMHQSRDNLEAENKAQAERLAETERRLAQVQHSRDDLEAESKAQTERLADTEQRLTEVRHSRDDLAAQSKAQRDQLAELHERNTAMQKEVETYGRRLLRLESANADLMASNLTLQEKLEAAALSFGKGLTGMRQLLTLISRREMPAILPEPRAAAVSLEEAPKRLLGDIRDLQMALTNRLRQEQEMQRVENAAGRAREEQLEARGNELERRLQAARAVLDRLPASYVVRFLNTFGLWTWVKSELETAQPPARPPVPVAEPSRELKRICVDLTPVLPGGDNGGAKILCLELIKELSRQAPECEFVLLTSAKSHDELAYLDSANVQRVCVTGQPQPVAEKISSLKQKATQVLSGRVPKPVLKKLADMYQGVAARLQSNGSLVSELGGDLLFCPFTAPFYFDARVPIVSVVLDIQYFHYPEFFSPQERAERDRHFRLACRVASRVICISEFVRRTVLEATSINPVRVETVHIAVQNRFGKPSAENREAVLVRHGVRAGRYLLYPANFWQHKNHELLLTAFGMHRVNNPGSDLKLVFTGAPGARMEYLREACRKMGLGEQVVFAGFVPDEEFALLLRACLAVIFPSLYEGFGIPVWEAMAAGKPVLCSNVTALPEICGDAAVLFDPRKPDEIAKAIQRIETEPQLLYDLSEKGKRHVAEAPDQSAMAARYLEVFREAFRDPGGSAAGLHGLYPDRWTGERAVITYPPSNNDRTLVLALAAAEWIPTDGIDVQLPPTDNGHPQIHRIIRGKTVTIRRSLPKEAGFLELICDNTFQPSLYFSNEDTRSLGCRVELAQIVCPDQTLNLLETEDAT